MTSTTKTSIYKHKEFNHLEKHVILYVYVYDFVMIKVLQEIGVICVRGGKCVAVLSKTAIIYVMAQRLLKLLLA